MDSVQYSSKVYRGLQAWEYPCGLLWLIISGHVIRFQLHPAGNNTGIGNFERIIGSFGGIKE